MPGRILTSVAGGREEGLGAAVGSPLWGPVEVTCKGIPSCPSYQYLDVLLDSSLQFVPLPLISLRPGLLVGRSQESPEAPENADFFPSSFLLQLYSLDDSAPARGWKSLSPCSWTVINKTHPASGEQGFSAFLESRAAGSGSSVGVDGSPLLPAAT